MVFPRLRRGLQDVVPLGLFLWDASLMWEITLPHDKVMETTRTVPTAEQACAHKHKEHQPEHPVTHNEVMGDHTNPRRSHERSH